MENLHSMEELVILNLEPGSGKKTTAAMIAALASRTDKNDPDPDMRTANCSLDGEQMSNATWTFLYATAAYY